MPRRNKAASPMVPGLQTTPGAQANYFPPPAPTNIPEGSTAGEREMLTAMLRFQKYNNDTEAYLKFLEFEAKAHRIDPSTHNRLHNEAVDALQASVNQFNLHVRTYKARDDVRRGSRRERRH